jgi:hypothetical protein
MNLRFERPALLFEQLSVLKLFKSSLVLPKFLLVDIY